MDSTDPRQHLLTAVDMVRYAASEFARAGLFYGHGTDNMFDEAMSLVLHVLALPHDTPEVLLQGRLTAAEKTDILALIARRVEEKIPLAYLTGRAWFAGLEFEVDSRVLVPRSPLAELIEQGLAPWVERPERVGRVLDMCTGSGCIGIAAAFAFPAASVELADISADALAVAEANIVRFGLQDRVRTVRSDLFDDLPTEPYDIILCNPPYVSQAEYDALPAEYGHEPELGLVSGADGLDAVRRLLDDAHRYLSDDGVIVIEVGDSASAVVATWPTIPFTWLEFEHGGSGVFLLSAMDARLFRRDAMT